LIDVGIQVVGWALSCALSTEKYYDMCGSLTFIAIAIASLLSGTLSAKHVVLCAIVLLWALRLGSFLVVRVHKTGGDQRFDKVKGRPGAYAVYWLLQGLWVYVTLLPFLFAMSSSAAGGFGVVDSIGLSLFALGFLTESIADLQKFKFKMDGQGGFISSGLWRYSRHPNYFGEMIVWLGVYLVCLPSLSGAEHLAAVSPVFVSVLISCVSGIPLLERSAQKKWGHLDSYLEYKETTPLLIPGWVPGKRCASDDEGEERG